MEIVLLPTHGNSKGERDAGERSMDARFQYEDPQQNADDDVGGGPRHASLVHYQKDDESEASQDQRRHGEITRVENGNDYDSRQVVEDGYSHQEQAERLGNPVPQQVEDAKGKGDVGCGGNCPAAHCYRVAAVEPDVDEGRDGNPAKRGDTGKDNL